jgi:hypothetical protein
VKVVMGFKIRSLTMKIKFLLLIAGMMAMPVMAQAQWTPSDKSSQDQSASQNQAATTSSGSAAATEPAAGGKPAETAPATPDTAASVPSPAPSPAPVPPTSGETAVASPTSGETVAVPPAPPTPPSPPPTPSAETPAGTVVTAPCGMNIDAAAFSKMQETMTQLQQQITEMKTMMENAPKK